MANIRPLSLRAKAELEKRRRERGDVLDEAELLDYAESVLNEIVQRGVKEPHVSLPCGNGCGCPKCHYPGCPYHTEKYSCTGPVCERCACTGQS